MRDLCNKCNQRPVAINYYKEGKPYYRTKCDHCASNRKDGRTLWQKAGYKKKATCDKCSFSSKYPEQFDIFYVDGDPTNCRYTNLKTVCANCQRIVHKLKIPWRQGDLRPDC